MQTLNAISLFTGSGQLDIGVGEALRRHGFQLRVVCYVENNPFAAEVIRARVRDRLIEDAPIWPDVLTFPAGRYRGIAEAVIGGFPCQPFSVAGKRAGEKDERYLFGEVVRVAGEAGCSILCLENVPGLLVGDKADDDLAPIGAVAGLLAESGFDGAWLPLSAANVGAPHGRERVWILGWRREQGDAMPIICDGCNVREPFEHRCHGRQATVRGERTGRPCECTDCREPSAEELAKFRAELEAS